MVADAFDSASARRGRRTRSTTRSTTSRLRATRHAKASRSRKTLPRRPRRACFASSSRHRPFGASPSLAMFRAAERTSPSSRAATSPTVKSPRFSRGASPRRPRARRFSDRFVFGSETETTRRYEPTRSSRRRRPPRRYFARARRFVSVASDRRVRRRRPSRRRPTASGWRFRRVFSRRGDRRRRVRVSRGGARTRLVRGAPAGRHRVGDERRGAEGAEGAEGRGRDGGVGSAHRNLANVVADGRRVFRQVALASSIERATRSERDPKTNRRARVFVPGDARGGVAGRVVVGGFRRGGSRARAWRVGDEPAWTGVSQGTRAETPRNDESDDSTPNPAFSRATRRGVAIPTPTFSEERIAPRGDAPDAARFSPEGDALVGVFDGGMRATWRVPVGPRGHTWTLRKVTFDADRDVLALAVVDGGGVEKNPIHARRVRRSRRR